MRKCFRRASNDTSNYKQPTVEQKLKVNLFHIAQLQAIDGFLTNRPDFVYRKICRWFSKTFSTPLMDVLNMPMPVILQHYYESEVEDADYNHIYELAKAEYLPEFVKKAEEEDQAYADSLVEEQERTLKAKVERDKKAKEQEVAALASRMPSEPDIAKDQYNPDKAQSLKEKPSESVEEFDLDFEDSSNPDEDG